MNYKTIILVVLSFLMISNVFAQFPEKEIMKKLRASEIKMDEGNGDGVFRAKSKKTNKWGMYQWMFEGTKVKEMIPMEYDSLKNFPFNGNFTQVYNDGKVGIYLCEWSYQDNAKQTVACKYEDYRRINVKKGPFNGEVLYLAMKKNGKWGYVDWFTGEKKTEFIYNTTKDLPYPDFEQKSH